MDGCWDVELMGIDPITWDSVWNGRRTELRTDSCFGAETEEVGTPGMCDQRIRKQGLSKKGGGCDSGLPQEGPHRGLQTGLLDPGQSL